jgi:hypothetical protein
MRDTWRRLKDALVGVLFVFMWTFWLVDWLSFSFEHGFERFGPLDVLGMMLYEYLGLSLGLLAAVLMLTLVTALADRTVHSQNWQPLVQGAASLTTPLSLLSGLSGPFFHGQNRDLVAATFALAVFLTVSEWRRQALINEREVQLR